MKCTQAVGAAIYARASRLAARTTATDAIRVDSGQLTVQDLTTTSPLP
jgi:hypothetical protein